MAHNFDKIEERVSNIYAYIDKLKKLLEDPEISNEQKEKINWLIGKCHIIANVMQDEKTSISDKGFAGKQYDEMSREEKAEIKKEKKFLMNVALKGYDETIEKFGVDLVETPTIETKAMEEKTEPIMEETVASNWEDMYNEYVFLTTRAMKPSQKTLERFGPIVKNANKLENIIGYRDQLEYALSAGENGEEYRRMINKCNIIAQNLVEGKSFSEFEIPLNGIEDPVEDNSIMGKLKNAMNKEAREEKENLEKENKFLKILTDSGLYFANDIVYGDKKFEVESLSAQEQKKTDKIENRTSNIYSYEKKLKEILIDSEESKNLSDNQREKITRLIDKCAIISNALQDGKALYQIDVPDNGNRETSLVSQEQNSILGRITNFIKSITNKEYREQRVAMKAEMKKEKQFLIAVTKNGYEGAIEKLGFDVLAEPTNDDKEYVDPSKEYREKMALNGEVAAEFERISNEIAARGKSNPIIPLTQIKAGEKDAR